MSDSLIDHRGPWNPEEGLSLVGFRGTGKSTVGRKLAERLGRPFADADVELERHRGRTIRAIFAGEGEPVFREYEEVTLRELTMRRGLILATGGGAVLREANRQALCSLGPVVWLRTAPEVIVQRLRSDEGSQRPALTPAGTLAEVSDVLAARDPLYRAVADFVVATDGLSPEDVVEAILAGWRKHADERDDGTAAMQTVGRMP